MRGKVRQRTPRIFDPGGGRLDGRPGVSSVLLRSRWRFPPRHPCQRPGSMRQHVHGLGLSKLFVADSSIDHFLALHDQIWFIPARIQGTHRRTFRAAQLLFVPFHERRQSGLELVQVRVGLGGCRSSRRASERARGSNHRAQSKPRTKVRGRELR